MPKKQRSGAGPDSYLRGRPSWRLSKLRMDQPFGWDQISRTDLEDVVTHLSSLESMTWSEIVVAARKQNHYCDVEDLSKPAREIIIQDWRGADQVLSIRLTNLKRVWGIMEQGVLYLLWWDPDHQVYPSTFKDRFS